MIAIESIELARNANVFFSERSGVFVLAASHRVLLTNLTLRKEHLLKHIDALHKQAARFGFLFD